MTTAAVDKSKRAVRPYRTYEEYLALPNDGRLVEWVDGEILTHMPPSIAHQDVIGFIESLLRFYVNQLNLGWVLDAPEGVFISTVVPGFRLPVAALWQTPPPNPLRVLAAMLVDAPGLSDELRAVYREMLRLLP